MKINKRAKLNSGFSWEKAVMFFLVLLILWILVQTAGLFYRRWQVAQDISVLKRRINELNIQNADLENQIKYLGSQEYLEKEARLKLGLKQDGESVVIIPPSDKNASTTETDVKTTTTSIPTNPIKWWQFFFR